MRETTLNVLIAVNMLSLDVGLQFLKQNSLLKVNVFHVTPLFLSLDPFQSVNARGDFKDTKFRIINIYLELKLTFPIATDCP